MVGVEVREEDVLQVDEADRGAEELALRAFPAVEEQTVASTPDEQGARTPAGGRRARGGAEEDDVEIHRAIVSLPLPAPPG